MKEIYDDIWRTGSAAIGADAYELDEQVDSPTDTRRGITLIFRPDESLLNRYAEFLRQVEQVEPDQYLYAPAEIHTTVLSIITCAEGFKFGNVDIESYEEVVASCAHRVDPFEVEFRGLSASPNCVMAQGFPLGDSLERLRSLLRDAFQQSELQHTIDARYPIATAHSALVRFRKPLKNAGAFLDFLKQNRQTEWGRLTVAEPVLVHNDWYHKTDRVQDLASFPL